jgi:hypothetical protein
MTLAKLVIPRWFSAAVIVAALLARFLPHPWNLTPVGSMFLFCGFAAVGLRGFVLPLAGYALSDVALNTLVYHTPFGTPSLWVWAAFFVAWLIGRALRKYSAAWAIYPAAVLSAVSFFAISNFGSWILSYPHTLAGLLAAYTAALPFFQPTLLGDLVYSTLFFGLAYALNGAPRQALAPPA